MTISAARGAAHRSATGLPARLPARLIVRLIRGYQTAISPGLGPACRYLPTCSDYALQAIERHGVVRGGAMSVWRLLRCNPFSAGGYDPPSDPAHAESDAEPRPAGQTSPRASRWRMFHVKHRPGAAR